MQDRSENPVDRNATSPRFESVELKRFRAFRALSIHGLGRVNLITGRNNTGKSSVLEGLRILTTNAALDVICDILRYREEDGVGADEEGHSPDPESMFQVSGFFHGFPQLSGSPEPIIISSIGRSGLTTMTMRLDWFSRKRDPDGNYRLVTLIPDLFGDSDGIAALVVKTGDKTRGGGRNARRRGAHTLGPQGKGHHSDGVRGRRTGHCDPRQDRDALRWETEKSSWWRASTTSMS